MIPHYLQSLHMEQLEMDTLHPPFRYHYYLYQCLVVVVAPHLDFYLTSKPLKRFHKVWVSWMVQQYQMQSMIEEIDSYPELDHMYS